MDWRYFVPKLYSQTQLSDWDNIFTIVIVLHLLQMYILGGGGGWGGGGGGGGGPAWGGLLANTYSPI